MTMEPVSPRDVIMSVLEAQLGGLKIIRGESCREMADKIMLELKISGFAVVWIEEEN